jgi:putative transcriptional regulator
MITHHIPDDLLMGYATGGLTEAFDLVVAAHVSLNDDARARLSSFEALGGAVIEDSAPVEVDANSYEATMARIMGTAPAETVSAQAKTLARNPVFPRCLRDYVGGDLEAVKWRPVGLGVKHAVLNTGDSAATARLLCIPAGQAMPDHGHNGVEVTLVLKGAFIDADGRFARGDIEVACEETEHTPVADIAEDCICLVVTDAPLRFTGLLPKIAQKILRI